MANAYSDRYQRQTRFLGSDAQRRLAASRVVVVGCGALGGATALSLARAGVGFLRLIDRDFLEPHNLQRQDLFDEQDLADDLPKAEAAARRLRRVNSSIEVDPQVADLTAANVVDLCGGFDLVIDGLDGFPTRFLLNDFACRSQTPWVFAGCIGGGGQVMAILPGRTPCLRCVMDSPPAPGTTPTCETAGILGPAVQAVSAFQSAEALKILTGESSRLRLGLVTIDVWENVVRPLALNGVFDRRDCPACSQGKFEWLEEGIGVGRTSRLCGRNAVQVSPAAAFEGGLEGVERRLSGLGVVSRNRFLLRFASDAVAFTLFPDGRAIVQGTEDFARARSIYARYIGE